MDIPSFPILLVTIPALNLRRLERDFFLFYNGRS
jgi:hypothetical protein